MKKFIKEFLKRGMLAAWGGPVILAIVWICLQSAGVVTQLSVNEVALGIITSTIMAFIAAGISAVYTIESLPKVTAGLIQALVLYFDYLGVYLLNGWMSTDSIIGFTLIFAAVFIVIWIILYFSIMSNVKKMNEHLKNKTA